MVDVIDETVRIPANIMGLLRQSYDSREKMLDWLLAIAVVGIMVWAFWKELAGLSANSGDSIVPSHDVGGAFAPAYAQAVVYTYNQPGSRQIPNRRGPAGTRRPFAPGPGPYFPGDDNEKRSVPS